jgi:hypothetical protein
MLLQLGQGVLSAGCAAVCRQQASRDGRSEAGGGTRPLEPW